MKHCTAIGCMLGLMAACPVDAQEWTLRGDYVGSVNRDARDIDLTVLTLSAPHDTRPMGEYGLQGGFFNSSGRSTEDGGITYQSADANAVFVGGYARLAPAPPEAGFKPFVEIGIAAVVTDRNLPAPLAPGDPRARFYGKFDARLGAEVQVTDNLAIEGSAVLTHISNATGIGPGNLNFDGAGLSIGFTRSW